jgi:hypothetical protein
MAPQAVICPPPAALQGYVDGHRRGRRRLDRHLLDCAVCRDQVRQLRRIEAYLSAALPRGRRKPSRSWRRVAPGGLLVALAAAVFLGLPSGGAGIPDVLPAGPRAAATLLARASFPDLSAARSEEEVAAMLADAGYLDAGGPLAARGPRLHTALRLLLAGARAPAERRVLLGHLVRAGRREAVGELVREFEGSLAGGDEVLAALSACASLGGRAGVRGILRIAESQQPPVVEALEALLACGEDSAADAAYRLLIAGGVAAGERWVWLGRFPGPASARRLVSAFLAGDDSPMLERVLAGRPDAGTLLRASLRTEPRDRRARVLGLLARLGDVSAVPDLVRLVRARANVTDSLASLGRLARSGCGEAVLALARMLPAVDAADVADEDGIIALLSGFDASAASAARRHLDGERGAEVLDPRRRLLATVLLGREAALPAVEEALGSASTRRAAAYSLRFLRGPDAERLAARAAQNPDRAVRRMAFEAVMDMDGPESTAVLLEGLRRSEDRAPLVRDALRAPPGRSWRRTLLEAALAYRDSRGVVLAAGGG